MIEINNYGGVLGGMMIGMLFVVRVVFKLILFIYFF